MMTEQFYAFMRERELVRLRRLAGLSAPWTEDPILRKYKFTNVKRQDDWTTRTLLSKFYDGYRITDGYYCALANCTIARFVGLAESVVELGFQYDFSSGAFADNFRAMVAARKARRQPIFTGAYMIPNMGSSAPKHEIVIEVVQEVYDKAQNFVDGLMPGGSFHDMRNNLCSINGFGSFMAKEVLLDFKLITGWQPSDWEIWTPIGPGARRGATRVRFDGSAAALLSEKQSLDVCRELFEYRHSEHWGGMMVQDGQGLGMLPDLELCDIQFQLCEFDKYQRALRSEGKPKSIFRPRVN